jgi:hypothetical protein
MAKPEREQQHGRVAPTLAGLRAQRAAIVALAAQYGASEVRVFGSVARGEATPASDVDLLVDFAPQMTLVSLSALVQALRDLTGCPVQVTSAAHVREELRARILREAVPL